MSCPTNRHEPVHSRCSPQRLGFLNMKAGPLRSSFLWLVCSLQWHPTHPGNFGRSKARWSTNTAHQLHWLPHNLVRIMFLLLLVHVTRISQSIRLYHMRWIYIEEKPNRPPSTKPCWSSMLHHPHLTHTTILPDPRFSSKNPFIRTTDQSLPKNPSKKHHQSLSFCDRSQKTARLLHSLLVFTSVGIPLSEPSVETSFIFHQTAFRA